MNGARPPLEGKPGAAPKNDLPRTNPNTGKGTPMPRPRGRRRRPASRGPYSPRGGRSHPRPPSVRPRRPRRRATRRCSASRPGGGHGRAGAPVTAARPRPGDRIPPYDLDAERAVLGAMLYSPAAAAVVAAGITPDVFYAPRHADIAGAVLARADRGDDIDPVTVAAHLATGGAPEAVSVVDLTALELDAPTSTHAASDPAHTRPPRPRPPPHSHRRRTSRTRVQRRRPRARRRPRRRPRGRVHRTSGARSRW